MISYMPIYYCMPTTTKTRLNSVHHHHRVIDIHCQIDSSQCLAQLTPARVGKTRSDHVQLGASSHCIRWDIDCLSPQSHTSVWESFHIFIIARQRPFCTNSRLKLLQVDQGSSVPLATCSFGMIPLSRHSAMGVARGRVRLDGTIYLSILLS